MRRRAASRRRAGAPRAFGVGAGANPRCFAMKRAAASLARGAPGEGVPLEPLC